MKVTGRVLRLSVSQLVYITLNPSKWHSFSPNHPASPLSNIVRRSDKLSRLYDISLSLSHLRIRNFVGRIGKFLKIFNCPEQIGAATNLDWVLLDEKGDWSSWSKHPETRGQNTKYLTGSEELCPNIPTLTNYTQFEPAPFQVNVVPRWPPCCWKLGRFLWS